MVTDMLLDIIYTGATFIISLLPTLDLSAIPITSIVTWLHDIFNTVSYVVPIKQLMIPFLLWFAIKNFHFLWRAIQRIWDAIPLT